MIDQIQQEHRGQLQNWEGNVLVPLVQNAAGGVAAAIMIATVTYAWDYANGLATDGWELLRWGVIIGVAVAAIATIVRFFGDEVGLMRAVYVAGQRSRDDEIQRLNRQISLMEQQQQPGAMQDATAVNARLGQMAGDRDNAVKLLKILLDGGSVARSNSEHGLGRRPWERAVALLEKAKIYRHDVRMLLIENRSEALKSLAEFYDDQYRLAQDNSSFHPAWW